MLTNMPGTPSRQDENRIPPPVEWLPDGSLRLIDQSALPSSLEYMTCTSVEALAETIRTLRVRGAPTLGIVAAYGLGLQAVRSGATTAEALLAGLEKAADLLRSTRPTAVNLGWALDEVLAAARVASRRNADEVRKAVLATAQRIERENEEANRRMGEYGASLLEDGMNVLTHCNAGPLAALGTGTALGVIYTAHRQGKRLHVWVDETRPVLQGARLTTWELMQWGIPCTLITDNMAASLMGAGKVDAVITGADRIAANGDAANKIGTYGLAVLAGAHGIPFYVAAPNSTVDLHIPSGEQIKIEQRNPDEVAFHGGKRLAPEGVQVYNPAFDVTPARLVRCIITESGILRPPYSQALKAAVIGRTEQGPATSNQQLATSN